MTLCVPARLVLGGGRAVLSVRRESDAATATTVVGERLKPRE